MAKSCLFWVSVCSPLASTTACAATAPLGLSIFIQLRYSGLVMQISFKPAGMPARSCLAPRRVFSPSISEFELHKNYLSNRFYRGEEARGAGWPDGRPIWFASAELVDLGPQETRLALHVRPPPLPPSLIQNCFINEFLDLFFYWFLIFSCLRIDDDDELNVNKRLQIEEAAKAQDKKVQSSPSRFLFGVSVCLQFSRVSSSRMCIRFSDSLWAFC